MHQFCDMSHNIDHDRISELSVGPHIRNRNPERVRETHQPCAFARCQPAWIHTFALVNEDFRTVLVVACREGARHAVRVGQPEAETVAGGAVLGSVGLQVGPELVGQGVFLIDTVRGVVEETFAVPWQLRLAAIRFMQYLRQFALAFGGQRQGVEVEVDRFAKADDENALTVLRYEVGAVDDAIVDVVAEFVAQGAADDVEGAAFIVRDEVFDVFQQEGARALGLDDAGDVEKERALRFAGKAVGAAKRVFLGDAGNREGLAGKAGEQQVVIGNFGGVDLRNVAIDGVTAGEIFGIGLLRVAIPLAGEHATPAQPLECHSYTTDAGEEVNIVEAGFAFEGRIQRQQALQAKNVVLGHRLVDYPAANGTRVNAEVAGDIRLFVMFKRCREVTCGEIAIGAGMENSYHDIFFLWEQMRTLRPFITRSKLDFSPAPIPPDPTG